MLIIVSYDISNADGEGKKRLRHVAKQCLNHGQRVQYSVFECQLDNSHFQFFRESLLKEINPEQDSLRFYLLGNRYETKVEHYGKALEFDLKKSTLIL